METKIKLSQAESLQKELSQLLQENVSFPLKFEVRNIINSFKDSIENYRETIKSIFEKYGEIDEDKGTSKILEKNQKVAEKELKALNEKEIKVKGKIKLEDLEKLTSEYPYFLIFDIVKK